MRGGGLVVKIEGSWVSTLQHKPCDPTALKEVICQGFWHPRGGYSKHGAQTDGEILESKLWKYGSGADFIRVQGEVALAVKIPGQ